MSSGSPRSLRRAYVDWVEERIEEYKERIPRGELLTLADRVVESLRVSDGGQYQLTEILLCNAIDRHIFRMLKLPGYRTWVRQMELQGRQVEALIPPPRERARAADASRLRGAVAEDDEVAALACVV